MKVRQAIILAAGLGTRLRPITQEIPKPALPLGGLPIIFYNLALLEQADVREVTINLFHRPWALRRLFKKSRWGKLKINWSLEQKILGTAGGIAKALRKMKAQPSFVINGDILTDIKLQDLARSHQRAQNLATLALVPPDRQKVKNYIFYSPDKKIQAIGPNRPAYKKGVFSGVHLVEPQIFSKIPPNTYSCVIQDIYQKCLNQNQNLGAYLHRDAWWDLGQLSSLKEVDERIWKKNLPQNILQLHAIAKGHLKSEAS